MYRVISKCLCLFHPLPILFFFILYTEIIIQYNRRDYETNPDKGEASGLSQHRVPVEMVIFHVEFEERPKESRHWTDAGLHDGRVNSTLSVLNQ